MFYATDRWQRLSDCDGVQWEDFALLGYGLRGLLATLPASLLLCSGRYQNHFEGFAVVIFWQYIPSRVMACYLHKILVCACRIGHLVTDAARLEILQKRTSLPS